MECNQPRFWPHIREPFQCVIDEWAGGVVVSISASYA